MKNETKALWIFNDDLKKGYLTTFESFMPLESLNKYNRNYFFKK